MDTDKAQQGSGRAAAFVGLSALVMAAGCGGPGGGSPAGDLQEVAAEAAATTIDGTVPLITGWALSVLVPGSDIPVMVRTHAGRCIEAGPALCRVERAQATATRADASGSLQVLADARWLVGFRQGIDADVSGKGGKTEAESLSMDNAADQLRAARDAVGASARETPDRTLARRDLGDLQDRVTMQTMQISYAPLPGLLSGAGGGAILAVWASAGTLGGYGLALLLALGLLAGPVLAGIHGWRLLKRRTGGIRPEPDSQTAL